MISDELTNWATVQEVITVTWWLHTVPVMQEWGTFLPQSGNVPCSWDHPVALAATAHPWHWWLLGQLWLASAPEKELSSWIYSFLTPGDGIQLQYRRYMRSAVCLHLQGYCQRLDGQSMIPACWHCWCVTCVQPRFCSRVCDRASLTVQTLTKGTWSTLNSTDSC